MLDQDRLGSRRRPARFPQRQPFSAHETGFPSRIREIRRDSQADSLGAPNPRRSYPALPGDGRLGMGRHSPRSSLTIGSRNDRNCPVETPLCAESRQGVQLHRFETFSLRGSLWKEEKSCVIAGNMVPKPRDADCRTRRRRLLLRSVPTAGWNVNWLVRGWWRWARRRRPR